MLIMSHIVYTTAASTRLKRLVPEQRINYYLIGAMSLFPDAVDRLIYVFLIASTQEARNIAHTVVFNAILAATLVAIRRRWWIYGLASMIHILFDTPASGLTTWAKHALWPFLGADLSYIGFEADVQSTGLGIFSRATSRIGTLSGSYANASWLYISLEIGAVIILIAVTVQRVRSSRSRRITLRSSSKNWRVNHDQSG